MKRAANRFENYLYRMRRILHTFFSFDDSSFFFLRASFLIRFCSALKRCAVFRLHSKRQNKTIPAYLFRLKALLLGLFFILPSLLVIVSFLLISYFLQLRGCKPPFWMARGDGIALRELNRCKAGEFLTRIEESKSSPPHPLPSRVHSLLHRLPLPL